MFETQFPVSRLFDHVRSGLSEEWRCVFENHVRIRMDNQPTCFTMCFSGGSCMQYAYNSFHAYVEGGLNEEWRYKFENH